MDITIRDATRADCDTIADFNCRMAMETEQKTLDPVTITAGVGALLEDPAKGQYWLAEVAGDIAGQIMVTYEWSDWRNGNLWWIQSVYVAPDYRRAGVFSALYKNVELLAFEDKTVCGIRLYVEKDNESARATYRNLGMSETGYRIMEIVF